MNIDKEKNKNVELCKSIFDDYLTLDNLHNIPIGLFSGKIGICIYLYSQQRNEICNLNNKIADELLDNTINSLDNVNDISLETGLLGACFGLKYLIDKKFVEGNFDKIINDIDDRIFEITYFEKMNVNVEYNSGNFKYLLWYIYYLSKRIQSKTILNDNKYIYEKMIINCINYIDSVNIPEKFSQPFLYSSTDYYLPYYLNLLGEISKLNIYTYKIERICNDMFPDILASIPLLDVNKILLSNSMSSVSHLIKEKNLWTKHQDMLCRTINHHEVINNEFRSKKIFIHDGLTGLYLLNNSLFKKNRFSNDDIINRIQESSIWDQRTYSNEISSNLGLIDGFAGPFLIIKNKL